jgi:hypothetical protein
MGAQVEKKTAQCAYVFSFVSALAASFQSMGWVRV